MVNEIYLLLHFRLGWHAESRIVKLWELHNIILQFLSRIGPIDRGGSSSGVGLFFTASSSPPFFTLNKPWLRRSRFYYSFYHVVLSIAAFILTLVLAARGASLILIDVPVDLRDHSPENCF